MLNLIGQGSVVVVVATDSEAEFSIFEQPPKIAAVENRNNIRIIKRKFLLILVDFILLLLEKQVFQLIWGHF
ncbi:MAG: hypothetical protein ABIH69_00415 [bacterium]